MHPRQNQRKQVRFQPDRRRGSAHAQDDRADEQVVHRENCKQRPQVLRHIGGTGGRNCVNDAA